MESFFGTLKTESFHEEGTLSVAELTTVINDYIHYYNHERISLNLKKLRPLQNPTPTNSRNMLHHVPAFFA
ncbi:IS3 family transposase [Neisseria dumasiana]|uniref:IS3 family transposase n=1 Tax=Neisseria dumasiana TaxID=1931275 RepID=UPI000A18FD06|nr:IS3 family transposase [Neisseria dumasiana]UOO83601.1 IS3 family transposase [Neisseria dumasiana]